MKKTSKLFLLFVGAFLLVSAAFISCNGSDEKKDANKDSVSAPKMEPIPNVIDTNKVDSGKGKPNPMGN